MRKILLLLGPHRSRAVWAIHEEDGIIRKVCLVGFSVGDLTEREKRLILLSVYTGNMVVFLSARTEMAATVAFSGHKQ